MHVGIDQFAATVRGLRKVMTLVSLGELVERHMCGMSTHGLAALTFDDAYASVGGPVHDFIAAESIPITVFVVADGATHGEAFWWDRIDAAFDVASDERWRAFESDCGLPDAFRTGQPKQLGRLRPFRQWMLAAHCGRWPSALEEPLTTLERDVGSQASQRPLTFAELDELLRDPLVAVGPHTVSHPVLPLLSDARVRTEIRTSFDDLRSRYPNTVPVLSVPFGLYDARTVRIAVEEGLTGCLTLGTTLLDDAGAGPAIPRVCLSAGHHPLKAVLFALGCWRGARPAAGAHHYPDLPSPTT